jgi:excisionase family DNA binding protein
VKGRKHSGLATGEAEGPGTSLALVPGLRATMGSPPQHESLLLRPREAARLLGIGRSTLFEMLARQELPIVRIGRIVRIPRHQLKEWVDEEIEVGTAERSRFMALAVRPSRAATTKAGHVG